MTIGTGKRLTLYWDFESSQGWPPGDAKDLFQNAELFLAPGLIAQPGIIGQGARFTTAFNSVISGDPFSVDLPVFAYNPLDVDTSGITWSMWIKFVGNDPVQSLFYLDDTGGNGHCRIGYTVSPAQIDYVYNIYAEDWTPTYNLTFTALYGFTLGQWYLVAWTYDKTTGGIQLSVNGISVGTNTAASLIPVVVGGHIYTIAGITDNGVLIDELGLSMVSNLTLGNLKWLYNTGAGRTWPAVQNLGSTP